MAPKAQKRGVTYRVRSRVNLGYSAMHEQKGTIQLSGHFAAANS